MTQLKKLKTPIDWDFPKSKKGYDIHSIHPYPAKFISEIPRKLISLYHPKNSSYVFDPFCGSGTTLVEAKKCGLNSVGVDLNPIACLISKVKTTKLSNNFLKGAKIVIENAKNQLNSNNYEIPNIPRLDHWFKKDIQKGLACLSQEILQANNENIKNALQVALSSIIVKVSNQESNTRYAAIEKKISVESVFSQFETAVVKLQRELSLFYNNLDNYTNRKWGKSVIIQNDILKIKPEDLPHNIGLIITSPPYPNAYEYWLYHKYRMYWLGMDPIKVRENEIGARPHYFKSRPQDENDFASQMNSVFYLLSNCIAHRGKACFIVSHSIIHGRIIDNVAILERAADSNGFSIEKMIERNLPKTRRAFNPKHSTRKTEYILIFSFEGKP